MVTEQDKLMAGCESQSRFCGGIKSGKASTVPNPESATQGVCALSRILWIIFCHSYSILSKEILETSYIHGPPCWPSDTKSRWPGHRGKMGLMNI